MRRFPLLSAALGLLALACLVSPAPAGEFTVFGLHWGWSPRPATVVVPSAVAAPVAVATTTMNSLPTVSANVVQPLTVAAPPPAVAYITPPPHP